MCIRDRRDADGLLLPVADVQQFHQPAGDRFGVDGVQHLRALFWICLLYTSSQSYRDAVTAKCRELLTAIVRPALAVRYVVALGRRDLLWELLPEYIEKNVLEVQILK